MAQEAVHELETFDNDETKPCRAIGLIRGFRLDVQAAFRGDAALRLLTRMLVYTVNGGFDDHERQCGTSSNQVSHDVYELLA